MTKEEAKQKIAELVKKYENLTPTEIKSLSHNEEATKLGFIMPLFSELGWNFEDNNEVVPEEKASNGRVDYAFKLKGVPQFYLEAKPLNSDLTNPDYIKQAITYAYNKGVTWALLTNFDELRLFNAQTGKSFISLSCAKYIGEFDDLWLLSKESLELGLLKEKATKYSALLLPMPIEKRLFGQLRQWREDLFNQLHGYNEALSLGQINEVIQRFFNRLIFIRTCEDRGIEGKELLAAVNQWKSSGHKGELIKPLKQIFVHYNDNYDSELFDKHLTDDVIIESSTIGSILNGLYDITGSMASYDFSVIDADVLGAVYEQYLGYVARKVKEIVEGQLKLGLTSEETFKIVSQKERRKEQGIYYTPKFVTDYIVKETVGHFIKEHDYSKVSTMRILDPACGSGSFLIRAYDELLKYHADQGGNSLSELDQKDRLSVLTSNIYGVDLDAQAVEIACLNLLLRTVTQKGKLSFLHDNIRQGNSLISGNPEELKCYFGENYNEKKPFNWEEEFPDIMKDGGFDVVIGNPPYGADFDEHDRDYIESHYPGSKDNKNSAMVFIERGLSLTKEGGFFSFIIPKSLAYSQKWASGRKLIFDRLGSACDASKAFKEVLLEQMVVVISRNFAHKPFYVSASLEEDGVKEAVSISKDTSKVTDTILLDVGSEELEIFSKMTSSNLYMRNISKTARGLPFQKHVSKDPKGVPIYRGDHIARYTLYETKETIPHAVLEKANTKIKFLQQPKIMSQRIIAHVLNPTDHIILMSVLDDKGVLTVDTVENTALSDKRFDYRFIVGLLNSKLSSWYGYRFIFSRAIRTMDFDDYYVGKLPLPSMNISKPADRKKHDDVVALVDRMLELNKKLIPIRDIYSSERDKLLKEIEKRDKEIDNLVYDLYRLTEAERRIVESPVT